MSYGAAIERIYHLFKTNPQLFIFVKRCGFLNQSHRKVLINTPILLLVGLCKRRFGHHLDAGSAEVKCSLNIPQTRAVGELSKAHHHELVSAIELNSVTAALNENWGWYHLMSVMKVKLGMMAEYMREWSYIADGPVYDDQMERAIRLIEVILDSGGESEYRRDEGDEPCLDSEHFSRYVNFRNRERFTGTDCYGHNFWCDAQHLRFIKA